MPNRSEPKQHLKSAAMCKAKMLLLAMLFNVLKFIMPVYIKRLFLITTTYVLLLKEDIFVGDPNSKLPECLQRLNESLRLVRFTEALRFPAELTGIVYPDQMAILKDLRTVLPYCNSKQCVAFKDASAVSEKLVCYIPDWLQYDTDEMRRDLSLMVSSLQLKKEGRVGMSVY